MSLSCYTRPPRLDVNGVQSFVDPDYYNRGVDDYTVLSTISLARNLGWRRISVGNSIARRYISDPLKTLLLELVRISPNQRVLELGAGRGSLSMHISKRYPNVEVYAFDKSLEGLIFLNLVKDQEKLSNLHIAHVNTTDIPVEDGYFDVAIVVGVLDFLTNTSPNTQLEVLREVRRLLKSGGKAVIGVENRFSYHRKVAGFLPRFVLNMHSEAENNAERRTYLRSRSDYQKLLRESAGFSQIETFMADPSYMFPKAISDPDNIRQMMISSHKQKDWKWIRLLPDSILRMIAPSFYFVVEK